MIYKENFKKQKAFSLCYFWSLNSQHYSKLLYMSELWHLITRVQFACFLSTAVIWIDETLKIVDPSP